MPKLLRVEQVDESGGLIVYADSDNGRCDTSKFATMEKVCLVNSIVNS